MIAHFTFYGTVNKNEEIKNNKSVWKFTFFHTKLLVFSHIGLLGRWNWIDGKGGTEQTRKCGNCTCIATWSNWITSKSKFGPNLDFSTNVIIMGRVGDVSVLKELSSLSVHIPVFNIFNILLRFNTRAHQMRLVLELEDKFHTFWHPRVKLGRGWAKSQWILLVRLMTRPLIHSWQGPALQSARLQRGCQKRTCRQNIKEPTNVL